MNNAKTLGYLKDNDMKDFIIKSLSYVDAVENDKKIKVKAVDLNSNKKIEINPMPNILPPRRSW